MLYNESGYEILFYNYAWNQPDAKDILPAFKKRFGLIGKFLHGCCFYKPNKSENEYELEPKDEDDYKHYYEIIKKSVNDNKDYLLDLVKDKKIIHPDFRKIDI